MAQEQKLQVLKNDGHSLGSCLEPHLGGYKEPWGHRKQLKRTRRKQSQS